MMFIRVMYQHYKELFEYVSPLKKYHTFSNELRTIKSLNSLLSKLEDYFIINLRKTHVDNVEMQTLNLKKKEIIKNVKNKEYKTMRLTFSTFANDFLEGYAQIEQCLKAFEDLLISEELEFLMLSEERSNDTVDRVRAHERIKAEFREEMKKVERKKKTQEEKLSKEKEMTLEFIGQTYMKRIHEEWVGKTKSKSTLAEYTSIAIQSLLQEPVKQGKDMDHAATVSAKNDDGEAVIQEGEEKFSKHYLFDHR